MKTIGLIGGMSWESTQIYYQIINQRINEALGKLHSAKMLIDSVDFEELEACQSGDDWERAGYILGDSARRLEKAGADFILICTNTMHKVAPQVASQTSLPLIHIADATAARLREAGISQVGLLGTKYTMNEEFYKDRLHDAGIKTIIPSVPEMDKVNSIIFHELCLGLIKDESREKYSTIIDNLKKKGAQGVILGCTEIGMLIRQKDASIPVFDTTVIHAEKAAELALESN